MPDPAVTREDIYRQPATAAERGVIHKPLSTWERVYNLTAVRKVAILLVLAATWEIYARWLNNPLLFPTFVATVEAFVEGFVHGTLLLKAWTSIKVLLIGYSAGIALGAVALNTHSGFLAVSNTMRMVGRNYGLRGLSYVGRILIPAAFPSILTGFKIGWAFAWRTLIAAELVFGVSSGSGGLGWFIYENKNQLEIPNVFAGLLTVIVIGLTVENVIFRSVEERTVRRWGMQS